MKGKTVPGIVFIFHNKDKKIHDGCWEKNLDTTIACLNLIYQFECMNYQVESFPDLTAFQMKIILRELMIKRFEEIQLCHNVHCLFKSERHDLWY